MKTSVIVAKEKHSERAYKKKYFKGIRKLPIACDKDIKTAVGEVNGPNVMTGYEDEATNFIVDSFRKSTCLENK